MPTASSAAAPFAARTVRAQRHDPPSPGGVAYSAVKYIEMPWPPPMHMETMASRFSG